MEEYYLDIRYNVDADELIHVKERQDKYKKAMKSISEYNVIMKNSGSMRTE